MTVSPPTTSHQNSQAASLQQDQSPTSILPNNILDSMPTSFVGIVADWISKITATGNVAQVGDLLISGRENDVYAERPPVKKWQA